jgi:hypothetical protein
MAIREATFSIHPGIEHELRTTAAMVGHDIWDLGESLVREWLFMHEASMDVALVVPCTLLPDWPVVVEYEVQPHSGYCSEYFEKVPPRVLWCFYTCPEDALCVVQYNKLPVYKTQVTPCIASSNIGHGQCNVDEIRQISKSSKGRSTDLKPVNTASICVQG